MLTSPRARSLLWRLGRKLYQHARLEGANDPRVNGEYWLLDAALARAERERPAIVLDVGANVGDWTMQALDGLARYRLRGELHAFEPAPSTRRFLERRFRGEPRVRLQPFALSDQPGSAPLYVVGELAGTNSLVDQRLGTPTPVALATVDAYLDERQLERVTFLKSDTEGHDLAVLRGGARALAAGRIDVWQFEYNSRWVFARAFLRDVFELIVGTPYALGKLHRAGIEFFDAWHPELERFFETNFVLVRTGTPLERLGRHAHFGPNNVAERAPR